MKQPKPFWKESHKCWYVQLRGKQHRLDPDREEAWKLYHQLMAGEMPVGSDRRVIVLIDQFLRWSQTNHAPDTFRFYRIYNQSFGKFIPARLKLQDLKPYHLTRWVDAEWPPGSASPNTRHGAIRAVQRAFSWAKKQGLIQVNPIEYVEKPKPCPRDVYLWPEQYEKVLSMIQDEPFRDVVEILRHTGARPQEVRIMEARWLDRENRCWQFPRERSKGKRKARVVLLNDRAFEISCRNAATHPQGAMFRNSRGEPWKKKALVDRCRRLRARLDFYVTPYAIRHTFATDAILRGVDLVTIAQLMGHVDLRMLSEIYQHVEKHSEHLRAGLEKATGHLRDALDQATGHLKVVG
jgi:site-specific recombinase XerD